MSLAEEIAAAAARLVVEDGMEYADARRKAARDVARHRGRRGELPNHEQLEDAVRGYIATFCADEQAAELRALREVARRWMERLAAFRPHLSGSVWRGTATRRSALHIDLYCDDPKAATFALLDLGVDFDVATRERPGAPPLEVLVVGAPAREHAARLGPTVTLHLALHDLDEQRGALRPDARGRSWRGDLAALDRLLDAEVS